MAGIYTRDNINYSQMLQNAIANRAKAAERQAAYKQAQGKLWGETATNVGKYFGRGIFATADSMSDEDEAELALLKEIKAEQEQKSYEEEIKKSYEEEIKKAYDAQVAQRQAVNDYLMDPYERKQPTVTEPWDGYSDVDIEDNLYRKALNRGVYA